MPMAAAGTTLRQQHRYGSSSTPHNRSLRRLSSNPECFAEGNGSSSSSSFFASYISRSLYSTPVPSQLRRSLDLRSRVRESDRKGGKLTGARRGGREVEDLGRLTTARRRSDGDVFVARNGSDRKERSSGSNGSDDAEGDRGLEKGDVVGGEVLDGLWMGEPFSDRVGDLCCGGESGDGKELRRGSSRGDVEYSGGLQREEGAECRGGCSDGGVRGKGGDILGSNRNAGDEENGSRHCDGLERGELANDEMEGLVENVWVETGGESRSGESVGGDRVENLCRTMDLDSGGCNVCGKGGSEENYATEERNDGLHDVECRDDVHNCGELEREELVAVSHVVGSSDWEELGRCIDDRKNGSEDGGGLVREDFVKGEEAVGVCNGSDLEGGNCDGCKLERGQLVSDESADFIGGSSAAEELGSGSLVHDQNIHDLISGKFSENEGNEDGGCECEGSERTTKVPNHAGFQGTSEEESSSQSSSFTNANSELDSVRSKILHELEKRNEAENSLIRLQKQWKGIASYFAMDELTFSPITVGQSLRHGENPRMQVCQDVLVAGIVCEALERSFSQAKNEASMGLLIESKNHEISQLRGKLKQYKTSNHEMTREIQELREKSRKRTQRRKKRQKMIWACVAFSVTAGASLVASSFLLSGGVPSSFLSSDQSK